MSFLRTFVCGLLIVAAAGCKAQNGPENPQVNRRIEVLVRSQFQIPPNYALSIGPRASSEIPGYDTITVTFTREGAGKPVKIDFLLSRDGRTLARLDKFDLTKSQLDDVSLDRRPVRGAANAPVTIVNFDDLECPYCARMHEQLLATLDHYKGKVRLIYKDFPLVDIHPWALHAAVDANCLATQTSEGYWAYVDYLHGHGDEVNSPDRDPAKSFATLDRLAREQGDRSKVNTAQLDVCLKAQDESTVRASMKEGAALNIDGTPTLYINGERIVGAQPIGDVWRATDRALAAAGVAQPATGSTTATSSEGAAAASAPGSRQAAQ